MSRSSSNSAVIWAAPCIVVDFSERRPPIVFRCSSSTSVTSSSIVSGLAPSSVAVTVTTGNSMFGIWSTPSSK